MLYLVALGRKGRIENSFDFFAPSTFGLARMNFYWAFRTCLWGFSDLELGCGSKFLPNSGRQPPVMMPLPFFPTEAFLGSEGL